MAVNNSSDEKEFTNIIYSQKKSIEEKEITKEIQYQNNSTEEIKTVTYSGIKYTIKIIVDDNNMEQYIVTKFNNENINGKYIVKK